MKLFGGGKKKVKEVKPVPVVQPDPEAEAKKMEDTAERKRRAGLAQNLLFQQAQPAGAATVQKTKLGQ